MKSSDILAKTDRTSWSRIAMVARFYMPFIGKKLIIFPAFSLLCGILLIFAKEYLTPIQFEFYFSFCGLMITILACLGAMPLGKVEGVEVETMLPALNCEKLIFYFLYTFLVMPLLVILPFDIIANLCLGAEFDMDFFAQTFFDGAEPSNWPLIKLTGYLGLYCMAASCLWGILAHRNQRSLWGLIYCVVFYLGSMFISALMGFFIGFHAALTGNMPVVDNAIYASNTIYNTICALWGLYLLFALWKCVRSVTRRQL